MLLISTASQAFATENESSTTATDDEIATTEENYGLIEDPYDRLETGFDDTTLSLASSYDPRDYGYATKTKSQGSYQLCWMYSTIGAAEQYISLNYGSHFDISEAHGAVALSNSIMPSYSDGTVYFTEKANKGGSPNDALSYLSNWNAPIFKDNPITWNSLVLQEDYSKDELSLIYSVPVNDNFLDAKSILI